MPRSKTATDCDVFSVISLAVNRPVQPPPMMATSTGLRLVMREPRFLLCYQLFGAIQTILPRPTERCRGSLSPNFSSNFNSEGFSRGLHGLRGLHAIRKDAPVLGGC